MSTEKKLTAMQEVIKELNDCLELSKNDFITQSLKLTIHICETKLEKEKQQIIDSFDDGQANYTLPRDFDNGKEYYEETYKKD